MEIPEYIICPMCKTKIKVDRKYSKNQEKIRGIETNDISSLRIELKQHAGYGILGCMMNVIICNHCKGILGISNLT